jgi:hypothetical protein
MTIFIIIIIQVTRKKTNFRHTKIDLCLDFGIYLYLYVQFVQLKSFF